MMHVSCMCVCVHVQLAERKSALISDHLQSKVELRIGRIVDRANVSWNASTFSCYSRCATNCDLQTIISRDSDRFSLNNLAKINHTSEPRLVLGAFLIVSVCAFALDWNLVK